MRAGRLTHPITIWRRSEELDEYRTPIEGCTNIVMTRAEVVQCSAQDFINSAGHTAEQSIVFRIRYRSDVRTENVVRCNGIDHEIMEIKEIGRRKALELRCVTRDFG
ncbi:phage head closure protein [Methylobrevis pamukkalensis]|uniref:Phage head-tail joining protein n=1 Tax=Methylobrevis pamukkalensis TaxID=1439726 RepID=A0A1E3GXU6_9HYPH|nr:phage head closure protein [Methylobrevis pamukkalensis]ODN68844.1 Phage head-tail joining protein [Methylobrevis pamukkalensis]